MSDNQITSSIIKNASDAGASPQIHRSRDEALSIKKEDWAKSKSSPQADAMQKELQQHVDFARQFIRTNSKGEQCERALKGLKDFENKYVRCASCYRDHTIFSLGRTNLATFCSLLQNPDIPLDNRTRAAENLCSTINVCNEGTADYIIEETSALVSQLEGIEGKFDQIKAQLTKQLLIKLVRHVVPEKGNAETMEVHRVNALHNEVASEIGLHKKDDLYASTSFAKIYGGTAIALIKTCLTPQAITNAVTVELESLAEASLGIKQGQKTDWNKDSFETLSDNLRIQFHDKVALHDLIEIDDETGQISIKSTKEIQEVALNLGKNAGVIPQGTTMTDWNANEVISADDYLSTVKPPSYERTPIYNQQMLKFIETEEKKKKNNKSSFSVENLNTKNNAQIRA